MAGSLLPLAKQIVLDNAANPGTGWQFYTYEPGTTTPKATYQDAALTTANTNPVVANARGEVTMYGSGLYRVILKDTNGVTIWDRDNVGVRDLSAADGAQYIGFQRAGAGAVPRTIQDELREQAVSLYAFGGTFQGDCIAAMDLALASGAPVIQVPDNVTLGKHVIASQNMTILGGKNVQFSASVPAAGFQVATSGRVVIRGFKNASMASYPDTGGVINDGHVFVSLAAGAVIDELIVRDNSVSGGKIGISAGFENGRTLNYRCEISGNICANQNGGLGGEGYGIHFANENDSGQAYIANNTVIEAGRHSFYIARNKSGAVTLVGNKALRHRENSTTKGVNVRAAYAIFRSSNVTGYGNQVDGFYDSAMMIAEEGEIVASPLNADSIRMYGTITKNPKNVTAAVWIGYTDPSTTATINGVIIDGLTFDSSLNGSQVFQYSWGRGIRIRGVEIIYRNLTSGSRMFLLQGNALSNSANVTIRDVNVYLLGCTGTFSIVRPIAPFATSAMPLKIRDINVVSNTGGATVNDWEPSTTVTNTEIDVFGFSFPTAASVSPKQTSFPSAIQTLVGYATWDPASVAVGGRVLVNVTVTGASPGDFCVPSFSLSLASMSMTASVEAANTVTVCLTNNSSAPVDLASGTVGVLVIKRK